MANNPGNSGAPAINIGISEEDRAAMVRVLVKGAQGGGTARELFPVAEKANDGPTADLLTQRMSMHEQTAWMLRSLLEQ